MTEISFFGWTNSLRIKLNTHDETLQTRIKYIYKQTGMQIISEVNTTNLTVLSNFFLSVTPDPFVFSRPAFSLFRELQRTNSLGNFILESSLRGGFRCNPQRPHSSSDWFSYCFPKKPHNQSYVWGETTDNLNKFREETRTYTNMPAYTDPFDPKSSSFQRLSSAWPVSSC